MITEDEIQNVGFFADKKGVSTSLPHVFHVKHRHDIPQMTQEGVTSDKFTFVRNPIVCLWTAICGFILKCA